MRSCPSIPIRFAVLAALALVVLGSPPSALARKTYHARSYHTVIAVQPDGSLRIREEIRMRFEGGPFTFFHRGVPTRHTDGIVDLSSPDSIEVRRRHRRIDVTWRFAPLRDAEQTFILEYTALNALDRTASGHRFRWYGFPEERPYRIEAATAELVLPAGWPEPAGLETRPRRAGWQAVPAAAEEGGIAAGASAGTILRSGPLPLKEDETVLLRADFAPGLITAGLPQRQKQREEWARRRPAGLAAAGLLLALSLGLVLWLRQRWCAEIPSRREPGATTGTPPVTAAPPDDLPPALVAGLQPSVTGSAPPIGQIATIFDLARRGAISVESEAKRSFFGSRTLRVRRETVPADLSSWERTALEAALRRARDDGSVPWSRAVEDLNRAGRAFSRQVRDELVRRGEIDPVAMATRRKLSILGAALLALTTLLLIAAVPLAATFGPWGVIPSTAPFIAALTALILGQTVSPHTPSGARRHQAWSGFRRYLKDAEKSGLALDAGRFHQWLPLATALGIAPSLVKSGKRWGLAPPDWFRSPDGNLGDMTAFVAVMTASSSHGGAGGGGGGGAGGGGSSSAG